MASADEDVTIELRDRCEIGNDKTVAIVMEAQASFYFVLLR